MFFQKIEKHLNFELKFKRIVSELLNNVHTNNNIF